MCVNTRGNYFEIFFEMSILSEGICKERAYFKLCRQGF